MQNLRPFVAKCYRGGRSIGNRQSRGFSSSSSPTKNEPSIWIKELGQKARYMREALDLGAELADLAAATGEKVAISADLNLFKPSKALAVYYDDLADLVVV
ncbi:unnamed protein product [Arabidopsis thaliana]|uniref:Uncharacterized protein n=1 Tax=Arabidopsis thaliana TaxID=3702 RepID=A0A5S9X8I7_ARATH|nr:unnamed protein product [Arabidopsis thaliana]